MPELQPEEVTKWGANPANVKRELADRAREEQAEPVEPAEPPAEPEAKPEPEPATEPEPEPEPEPKTE